jgi:hypothetical protein
MNRPALQAVVAAALWGLAGPALPHGCDPLDKYLLGHYHGECDASNELPKGKGEAIGADRYVGEFSEGRPDGRGVYTWENGARLEGAFREGKAHGKGVFVGVSGRRYEAEFVNGRNPGLQRTDCPVTPGPVEC